MVLNFYPAKQYGHNHLFVLPLATEEINSFENLTFRRHQHNNGKIILEVNCSMTTDYVRKFEFERFSSLAEKKYFHPFTSFHLFVHPLLVLDSHNNGQPLPVLGLMLCDAIACWSNLFGL